MPNIDFRKVTDIGQNGPYLNVRVEGPALDPDSVGVPSDFQVVDLHNTLAHSKLDNFYLTDENWDKGVARTWVGFLFLTLTTIQIFFKTGEYVRFVNGDARKITKITAAGKFLNVEVEGEVLNSERTGLPSKYSILGK